MAAKTLLVYDSQDVLPGRITAILADWHASSWLASYATISLTEIAARGENIANIVAREPAGPDGEECLRRMLDLRDEPEVRLAVLTVVGSDGRWIEQRRSTQAALGKLNAALPNRIAAIEVVVPYMGGQWSKELAPWPGWDTIVCAPEQSSSLEQPGLDIYCDRNSPVEVDELAAHAAAFIAGAVGLWAGASTSFFDHTDHADEIRVGRVSHRRIDATALADAIRSAAFKEDVLRSQAAELALSDGPLKQRAEELKEFISILPRPKGKSRPVPETIGFWASIKLFFSFMFSAMLRAPREVVATLTRRAKEGIATALQSVIFGQDSEMLITVGGVRANVTDDDLQSVQDELADLDTQLRKIPGITIPETGAGATHRAFWQTCFDNAFALLTGTRQGGADPCLQEGHARFFPAPQVAPQTGRWRPHGQLVSGVPVGGVALNDTRAVMAARYALELDQREGSGWRGRAEDHLASLRDAAAPWFSSYMGRVGLLISDELAKYEGIVAELLRRIQAMSTPDDDEADEIVRGMRNFSRWVTSLAVGGIGVAWLLRLALPWFPALLFTGLAAVGWLVAVMIKYVTTRQALFQLQYRRDLAEHELKQVLVELPVAVENARRLAKLYAQYRIWAPLLAAFLARPFGEEDETLVQFLGMSGAVPKSVSSGVYVPADEEDAGKTCAQIAEGLRYPVNRLWNDFMDIGYSALIATHPQFQRVAIEDIFGQSDTQPESFLPQWSASVLAEGTDEPQLSATVSAAMDRRQMQRLLTNINQDALTGMRRAYQVQQVGAGGRPAIDRLRAAHLRPTLFNAKFFSTFGIQQDVREADVVKVYSSQAIGEMPTRHWLDEVDTALVLSPPTTFAAMSLGAQGDGSDDDHPSTPPNLRGM